MKSWHARVIAGAVTAAVILGTPVAFAADLPTQKKLTLEVAQTIAQGAIDACRASGYKIVALVVDDANVVKVSLRDDASQLATVEMARLKANTVMAFGTPSDAFAKMGAPFLPSMTIFPGGLPITVGDQLIGAVAVSGAPDGAKDTACAQAGLNKAGKLK